MKEARALKKLKAKPNKILKKKTPVLLCASDLGHKWLSAEFLYVGLLLCS